MCAGRASLARALLLAFLLCSLAEAKTKIIKLTDSPERVAKVEDLRTRGIKHASEGKIELAEAAFRAALKEHTRSWRYELNFNVAFCLTQHKQYHAALKYLRRAMKINQTSEVQVATALNLYQEDRADEAEPLFESGLGKDPSNSHAQYFYGTILEFNNKTAEAVAAFGRAYEGLKDRRSLNRLGLALRQLGRGGDEEALYEDALTSGLLLSTRQRPDHITPGITVKPWYDVDEFPWLPVLEEACGHMKHEFLRAMGTEVVGAENAFDVLGAVGNSSEFKDDRNLYRFDPGKWHQLALYENGAPQEGAMDCPRTVTTLRATVPDSLEYGRVIFSAIEPGIHIVPHCGPTNERLTVHCGVIVPKTHGPRIKVGGIERGWEEGRCFVFDDSFEHEVVFPAEAESGRVILLFHIPHPDIAERERRRRAERAMEIERMQFGGT